MSMNTFVESRPFPESDHIEYYPHLPKFCQNNYEWAEQLYRRGDVVAVVAAYKNIPTYRQKELDRLISETYRKKLLTVPLLEASLLLLTSGVLPRFQSLSNRLEAFCSDRCLEFEQRRALEFVSSRNSNDIVIMVFRSDRLIATMTLFPFEQKKDIPSVSYLEMDRAFTRLPDVPALEIGRLAKTTCNGYALENPESRFVDLVSMAAAFIVAEQYVSKNDMLGDPDSFICGDTHGSLINSLKRFFPLTVVNSRINPDMLKDDNNARGMSIYFLQRQVLGSFDSSDELLASIRNIGTFDPELAHRITHLLERGLDKLGVASIRQFDPQRFRVYFFHLPYNNPRFFKGLARMEQMMQWMTERPVRNQVTLN